MRAKALTSLLGISLGAGRLEAALLRRAGDGAVVRQAMGWRLSLDPVTNDPELVGREIRNCLASERIRESRCVVCVPLKWALTLRTPLPDLSEEDVNSYIRVQAERQFPFAPEDLSISISRFVTTNGQKEALVTAIPMHHLTALVNALRLAKLKPIGITLEITSLLSSGASDSEGAVTLLVGDHSVDLAVSVGRQIVALRSLDEVAGANFEDEQLYVEAIARQIRITLGQIPEDVRARCHKVRVFAKRDSTGTLLADLSSSIEPLGLAVEDRTAGLSSVAEENGALATVSPGVVAAAATRLSGRRLDFDFLPPRVSRLKQITGRVSSRAALWLGGAAAGLCLVVVGAFAHQHWRLAHLESQWRAMESKVVEVSSVQDKVRQFRAWFGNSSPSLQIIRRLAEAFPEEGSVWASTVEIRESQRAGVPVVTCSGKARSDSEWQAMRTRLSNAAGVSKVEIQQVSGANPLQFKLTFQWNGEEGDGI